MAATTVTPDLRPPTVPLFKVFMAPKEELDESLSNIIHSGFVTQGPQVEKFEAALGDFFGTPRVLSLNSATSGLHLALHMLGKSDPSADWPGLDVQVDEVLTCPLTCTATNWPILANRLRIKWVDADPDTCNMCLDHLEAQLSPTTKVIMVVHWGGTPADLSRIAQIQQTCFERFGFRPAVVEDCAHAMGAEFKGTRLGTHGNICVFSLQAIKHLTTGDGGLIILPTSKLYERARLLRWFGIDRNARSGNGDFRMEPDIGEPGFKFHMNDINATIGLANLRYLSHNLESCRSNGLFFERQLRGLTGITLLSSQHPTTRSAYWLYTIRIVAHMRAQFIEHMKAAGVVVSAVHQRNDVHSCTAQFRIALPQLDQLAGEVICLPVGWWVDASARARIVSAVKSFTAKLDVEQISKAPILRSKRKCLITGGCGFIGHHVVEHFVKNTDYQVIVVDKLSYASKGYDRLRDTGVYHQIQTYCFDLSNPVPPGLYYEMDSTNVEVILHLAAETHVDNSIDTPVPFVENNINSTLNLLEYARRLPRLTHFVYFSTDEVFGSAAEDSSGYKEGDAHNPSNPYSASKSAAEMICQSYFNTYGVPLIVMNVMNAFGERQHPEKFIPICISKVLNDEPVTIHAYSGSVRAGSRWYIHARNIAAAVLFTLRQGVLGQSYNVQGEEELDNLQVAEFVAKVLGKKLKYSMHDNPLSRPGHDLRYALDGSKLREMGWELPLTFEESLRRTITWTLQNRSWLDQKAFMGIPDPAIHVSASALVGAGVRKQIGQQHVSSKL